MVIMSGMLLKRLRARRPRMSRMPIATKTEANPRRSETILAMPQS